MRQALQSGGGSGVRLAQRRMTWAATAAARAASPSASGAGGDRAHGEIERARSPRSGPRSPPASAAATSSAASLRADVAGDSAVAHRLPRPTAARIELAGDLADHALEAREVGLGGAQAHLRLVPAARRPATPAASSRMRRAAAWRRRSRRSVPAAPWEGEREPEEASANRILRRHGAHCAC